MFWDNTIFYLGCTIKFGAKHLRDNYKKILDNLSIDYIILEKEFCCGIPLFNAGYLQDFHNHVQKVYNEMIKEFSIKKIITACPSCAYTFKKLYPKVIKKWKVSVYHIVEIIYQYLEKNKIKLRKTINENKIGFHDPCHLGRGLNIYEEPRIILRSAGFKIIEPNFTKDFSFCCGGGGGLKSNYPEISLNIAKERIEQFLEKGCNIIVTSCPMCYLQLKEAAEKYFKNKVRVFELSEIINTGEK